MPSNWIARSAVAGLIGLQPLIAQDPVPAPQPGREWLLEIARRRAAGDHEPDRIPEGAALTKLGYDELRAIRFRPERRIWADSGSNFALALLHPGGIFRTRVAIHLVADGEAKRVEFSPDLFTYGDGIDPKIAAEARGFSGFRVLHPLNRPDRLDEFLVFQGASYFRALGRGHHFGVSARGLAIGTGAPEGEEFPDFSSFWIVEPPPDSTELVLHALLESKSLTGAYTFVARPGDETVIEVTATLFPRRDIEDLGIAPLTSMFLFDAANRVRFDDYRDAVHDSDGLQMITGAGERLWRPLDNPRELQMSAFADEHPKGFGLVQRRRGFAAYGDLEARYDLRPTAWVEPVGQWGPGAVVLVEIPTPTEFNDNIVAFWRPAAPLKSGEERTWVYRLRFSDRAPDTAPLARVVETRAGVAPNTGHRLFAIDFEPSEATAEEVGFVAEQSAGTIVHSGLHKLPDSGRRRVMIEFDPQDAEVAELRVHLTADGERSSEVWLRRWTQ